MSLSSSSYKPIFIMMRFLDNFHFSASILWYCIHWTWLGSLCGRRFVKWLNSNKQREGGCLCVWHFIVFQFICLFAIRKLISGRPRPGWLDPGLAAKLNITFSWYLIKFSCLQNKTRACRCWLLEEKEAGSSWSILIWPSWYTSRLQQGRTLSDLHRQLQS